MTSANDEETKRLVLKVKSFLKIVSSGVQFTNQQESHLLLQI